MEDVVIEDLHDDGDDDDDHDGDDAEDDDDDNIVIEDRLEFVAVCVGRISIGCLLWGQPVLETHEDVMIIFDLEFDVYLEVKMIKLFPNIKFLSSPQSYGRIPQLSWS